MATITKHRRKKGTVWSVRWYDDWKRERQKTFSMKRDADDFLAEIEAKKRLGFEIQSNSATPTETVKTFAEFAKEWFEGHCKVHKSETVWGDDWGAITNHLNPLFGDKKLCDLRKMDIKILQGVMQKRGLKPKTINNVCGLAHKIMNDCVNEWEYLGQNPFSGYKRLKSPKPDFKFWRVDERDRFLEHCKVVDPVFHDIFAFALHSGCRLGEVQALRRGCVDYSRGVVHVRRRYYAKTKKFYDTVKGRKAGRQIEMNSYLQEVMAKYRFLPADQLVFPLFGPNTYLRRITSYAKVVSVPRLKFHELRHTFASLLAMAGVSLMKIQYLLGHENAKETEIYAHLCPDATLGITEALVTPLSVESKNNAAKT